MKQSSYHYNLKSFRLGVRVVVNEERSNTIREAKTEPFHVYTKRAQDKNKDVQKQVCLKSIVELIQSFSSSYSFVNQLPSIVCVRARWSRISVILYQVKNTYLIAFVLIRLFFFSSSRLFI